MIVEVARCATSPLACTPKSGFFAQDGLIHSPEQQ